MPSFSQSNPPPIPPVTPEESAAQGDLRLARELLVFVEHFLESAYSRLPDPPNAEQMGVGEVPESLAFSLRGSIEIAGHDHIAPLHKLLLDAISETPARLVLEWQKRQRERR